MSPIFEPRSLIYARGSIKSSRYWGKAIMDESQLARLKTLLVEISEELRLSADLAEQVDLHAAAAKAKIADVRDAFEAFSAEVAR